MHLKLSLLSTAYKPQAHRQENLCQEAKQSCTPTLLSLLPHTATTASLALRRRALKRLLQSPEETLAQVVHNGRGRTRQKVSSFFSQSSG